MLGAPSDRAERGDMKRALAAMLLALAATGLSAATPATAATSGTTYSIDSATATPIFACNDVSCSTDVIGYAYQGDGTCVANCVGWPIGPMSTSIGLNVAKVHPPSPCTVQSGTGVIQATFASDPSVPALEGTFTFKAKDSKIVSFSGTITSSTVGVLPAGSLVTGFVTHPPSPCTGGIVAVGVTFGG